MFIDSVVIALQTLDVLWLGNASLQIYDEEWSLLFHSCLCIGWFSETCYEK